MGRLTTALNPALRGILASCESSGYPHIPPAVNVDASMHLSNFAFGLLLLFADVELLEGLDVSKHGERCMAVAEIVKGLDSSVHGGRYSPRKPQDGDDLTVTAV